jgi:MFS family permease
MAARAGIAANMSPAPTRAALRVDEGPDQRRNYALQLLGGGVSFVAGEFGSMRLVIPWIAGHLGVAYILVALIVPLVQFGLLVAQLGVAPLISRVALRKRPVVGLGLVMAATLLAIFGAAVGLPPELAGIALLFCAFCFAVSLGAFGVGYDDLLAKTVSEASRGRLVAHCAALGGALTLLVSLAVLIFLPQVEGNQLVLLWVAVAGWIGVVLAYAGLREPPSRTVRKPITLAELSRGFRLIASHPWFRRLLIGRALLLSVELAIPFYAIHAATLHDPTAQNLSVFVVASGIGVISGGLLWAGMSNSDRMGGGALCALLAGALTLVIDAIEDWQIPYFHALVFTLLTLGEQGSIQGEMTYMVDHAPADDRPALIATGNALTWTLAIGVALLLGAAGHLHDIRTALVVLMAFNVGAMLYVLTALRA